MGSKIKDFESRYNIQKTILGTGIIGPYPRRGESHFRVVVEGADTTNSIQPQGKLFGQTDWQDIGSPIVDNSAGATVDVSDFDEVRFNCDTYDPLSADGIRFIASGFFFESAGSGGGAVDSVNGFTGTVILTKSNIGLGNVNNTSDANKPVSTAQAQADADVQDFAVERSNHNGTQGMSTITSGNDSVAGFDSSGNGQSIPGWNIDNQSGGFGLNITVQPDDFNQFRSFNSISVGLDPIQDSPNDTWALQNNYADLDPNLTGFELGINGTMLRFIGNSVQAVGTSDLGFIEFIQNTFNVGNGTDPINLRGFAYMLGFGQINDDVTILNSIQGYGFQPNLAAGVIMDPSAYVNPFFDGANVLCASSSWTSFNSSPTIAEIQNNRNFQGFVVNPNIDQFTGNANVNAIGVYGQWGTFGTGNMNAININPQIDSIKDFVGIRVSMDDVDVYPGTIASLVIQDLTIAADLPSAAGNDVTIEYTTGATAGAEVVSQAGLDFSVQIESGVSTATQIAAALNAFPGFTLNLNVTISGVGGNAQVAQAPTSLAGGTDVGTKKAAVFQGDVEISGSLSFSGALSIGQLNAFASLAVSDGGGSPASIHSLVSQPTVAANTTVANGDTLGINTAMLLTMGDNAVVTTSFVGLAALALPAVVSMGTGATIDQLSGATFAISMDGGATGGVIATLDLCRAIAIPNGVTDVTKLRGYTFDLPFGDPGITTWGVYISPDVFNWMKGSLKIGGTSGSSDTADTGYKLHVEGDTKLGDAFEAIDGTGVGFYGATPVVQQASSGAATAGAVYTATEQAMIQEMYDALRAYGLLT